MAKVKLFWRKNCPKCPTAKALVANSSNTEYFDVDEVEGLAEAAFYGVMSTPSIIVTKDDGKEIKAWHGEVPKEGEIGKWLFH
jgi:thioredoxin-related protein